MSSRSNHKLELTFDQYNSDQKLLTRNYQEKLARNRDSDTRIKSTWNHTPNRKGFRIMRPEEVLKELLKYNIDINIRTLQRYAKNHLINKPKTVSAGRNHGRIADYADDTAPQIVALHQTQSLLGNLKQNDMAKIRKIALIKDKLISDGYGSITGADIINLCQAKGRPKPDLSEEDKFNFVDHFLHKEISELKNIPEDINEIIDLLVSNWIVAYSATQQDLHMYSMDKETKLLVDSAYKKEGLETIKAFKERWDEQIGLIANIYSQELIDKTIQVIRSLKI